MFGKSSPKLTDFSPLDFDPLDFEVPDIEVPDFLKLDDAWAVEIEVVPKDAPGLMHKSMVGGILGSSQKMKSGTITLIDIEECDPEDEVRPTMMMQGCNALSCSQTLALRSPGPPVEPISPKTLQHKAPVPLVSLHDFACSRLLLPGLPV